MLRFGVIVNPDGPFPELARRWCRAERLGFDSLWTADHTADYRDVSGPWFDGLTTLAAMALQTERIRIGTLVANPILRHPVILAKQATALDHLSGGRLNLGVGTGIAPFDHAALGGHPWPPSERVGRFGEYIELLDTLLRGDLDGRAFEGRWYQTFGTRMSPPPVQRPRPPLVVGGQSPGVLRVAAARADAWNTHGPFGRDAREIVEITAAQNRKLDELCLAAGRDPTGLRRSVLLFGPLDAWASPSALDMLVPAFVEAGISDFIVFWPENPERAELFERFATEVMPGLQAG